MNTCLAIETLQFAHATAAFKQTPHTNTIRIVESLAVFGLEVVCLFGEQVLTKDRLALNSRSFHLIQDRSCVPPSPVQKVLLKNIPSYWKIFTIIVVRENKMSLREKWNMTQIDIRMDSKDMKNILIHYQPERYTTKALQDWYICWTGLILNNLTRTCEELQLSPIYITFKIRVFFSLSFLFLDSFFVLPFSLVYFWTLRKLNIIPCLLISQKVQI